MFLTPGLNQSLTGIRAGPDRGHRHTPLFFSLLLPFRSLSISSPPGVLGRQRSRPDPLDLILIPPSLAARQATESFKILVYFSMQWGAGSPLCRVRGLKEVLAQGLQRTSSSTGSRQFTSFMISELFTVLSTNPGHNFLVK